MPGSYTTEECVEQIANLVCKLDTPEEIILSIQNPPSTLPPYVSVSPTGHITMDHRPPTMLGTPKSGALQSIYSYLGIANHLFGNVTNGYNSDYADQLRWINSL